MYLWHILLVTGLLVQGSLFTRLAVMFLDSEVATLWWGEMGNGRTAGRHLGCSLTHVHFSEQIRQKDTCHTELH